MAKGSQKQNNLLRQKAKSKIHSLERPEALEYIATLPNDWLPESVATIPKESSEDSETKKFMICFNHMEDAECKFGSFNPGKTKALLHTFKRVSDCQVRSRGSLVRDKIQNNPPYSSLFLKLTPDVDLYEIQFADTGRVFFFHVAEKFNVVSIEDTHRNI